MKATAWAPANIAFIKYWGKSNEELRLALNSSISMNLSGASTTTTVEFSPEFIKDEVTILDGSFSDKETERVIKSLYQIRNKAKKDYFAHVETKNTFPKGAGSAASASGFAALTMAAFAALGIHLPEKELTAFARLGSGSACRSIPDGFVMWEHEHARSLYPHDYWDLRDILVIVDSSMKKVSTSDGMEGIQTSPLLQKRLAAIPKRIERCLEALKNKDLRMLGEVCEEDCLDMHAVMQSQQPPLYYWTDATKRVIDVLKKSGLPAYFTIDAGPNVHIICEAKDEEMVVEKLKEVEGIETIIKNKPSRGAYLL